MTKLRINPNQAEDALATLQEYVRERAALLVIPEGGDHCQITTALEAVKLMDALYQFKEDVANRVKSPAEKAYDVLRFTVVPKILEGDGITTMSVAGIGRVNLQDDVAVKVKDPKALTDWLIDNELEDMIKETVNAQTLAAFVRRRIREGGEIPGADILEAKPLVRAVITRAGVK